MAHQKSSDYKETAVQYYLVEDKSQEEVCIYEFSYKMGVLNEKRCKKYEKYTISLINSIIYLHNKYK